jgi:DNA-binding MarR family transcriptional regulator
MLSIAHAAGMARTIPAADALTRLTLLVFRVNGLLLEAGDRLAAPAGQTSARWQVLGVVDHGPITVAAVARTMGITRQSVQRTADLLAESGFVAYSENPDDRRAQLIAITAKGIKALRKIEAAQEEWARELGKALGQTTLARTAYGLERIEELLLARGGQSVV